MRGGLADERLAGEKRKVGGIRLRCGQLRGRENLRIATTLSSTGNTAPLCSTCSAASGSAFGGFLASRSASTLADSPNFAREGAA